MDLPVDLLPTHIAAAKNDVQELARLVQQGETVIDNDTQESPLHAAARTGSVDCLRWLLENRVASPLTQASNGNTAAHYAVVYGHAGALKLLITNDPSISDQVSTETDENGLSILSLATLQGDEELVLWILDNFPHVAEVPNTNGNLAVHFAAAQGFLQILKLLVKKCGREIAEKQDNRLTKPVFFASQEGKLDVLDYLINELGVDPVARDKSGMSCVHAATQGGQSNAIKWLISKLGPKYILDKTIDGATPLHMAAALGHSDILRFFLDTLEDKNDIDVLDHIHATPAHDAAEYGQTEAMILLLKHGANINIKDTENKTPYELAIEQNHTEVANIISDFRENGPTVLAKYEKGKHTRSRDGQRGEQSRPRTSRQEAAEISNVIQQTSEVMEQRKEHQKRQDILNGNGRGERMDTSEVESKRKSSGNSQRKTSYPSDGEDEEIEHTLGPQGDIYARPRRRKHRKSSSRQNSDLEEFMSETMSHHSFSSAKAHPSRIEDILPLDDSPYALVNSHGPNLETASNYSRPSRVKRYQDSDSEVSSFTSSHHYRDGRHNIPGFYPGFDPHFPPPIPPGYRKMHSASGGSRHSSQGGHHRGYPPPLPPHMAYPGPYGYHPGMMAAYYGYPPYPPYAPGYHPKTTEERMHLAALQHGRLHPSHYQHPGMYMQGRRSALVKEPKGMPGPPKQHTDQDIGYGPEVGRGSGAQAHKTDRHEDQEDFHPPAPPVTLNDGSVEQGHDMVAFDSNFIMTKKTENAEVRQVAGTTLNPAKAGQKPYDGRWDEYITSDSGDEGEVEEQFSVSFAAEAVAILAIGCVAGLKGLQKVRKGKPSAISDLRRVEKSHLSSAWDAEPRHHQRDGSRKGPISALDDPTIKGMSPQEFASHEEWEGSGNWDKSGKKGDSKPRSSSTEALEKPQSELLTAELQKQSFSSVSKHLGQQILTASLGARDSSMLNIASSSVVSSRMSLNQSSDEDDDDDFGDAISMVLGIAPSETPRKKEKVTNASEEEPKPDNKKKERTKKDKDKKPKKEKKEKKEKKGKEGKHKKEKDEHKEEAKPVKDAKGERKPAAPVTALAKATMIPPATKTAKSPEAPPAVGATKTPITSSATKVTKGPKTPPANRDNKLGKTPPAGKTTNIGVTHPKAEPKKPEKPLISKSPGKTRKMMIQPSPPVPHKEKEVRLRAAETSSPPHASAPKAPRRERITQAPPHHSEKPTTQSTKQVPSTAAVGKEHTVSVTIPVRGQSSQTGPREVRNQFFDDESDEEPEGVPEVLEEGAELSEADQIEESMRTMADDLTRFLEEATWTSPTTSKHTEATPKTNVPPPPEKGALRSIPSQDRKISEPTYNVDLIEVDETSRDIFGDDGLAELNDALMQLSTIQAGISPDPAMHKAVMQTDDTKEKRGTSKQQELSGIGRVPPQTKFSDDSGSSSASESEEAKYEFSAMQKGHMKTQDKPRKLKHETQEVVLSFLEDDSTSSSVPQTSKAVSSQPPIQGMPRSSSFEQNLLATLNSLNETINQMKANPSATQTEINQQQQIQQQLIQNMLTYSQNDPQLMSKLLSLLQDKDTQQEAVETSSTNQLEQLEHKLLDVQQKQLHETKEHFRTQAEFQQAIQRKLEEQAEQQMKGIQSNFDRYTQLLEQQLAEQRRKWEEEMKKRDEEEQVQREKYRMDKDKKRRRSRDKKHKKKHHRRYSDSESSATDSGDDLVQPSPRTTAPKPAVKTMQAKIYTQELLDPSKILEESLPEPPVVPSVNQLLGNEKQKVALKRRETSVDFSRTTDALRRFEGELEEEEEEEEDDEMQFQHAKPVTLRRADIIQVQDTGDYTPHRSHGARKATKDKRAAIGVKGKKAELRKLTAADDEFHMLRPKSPTFIDTKEPAPEYDESRLKYGHQHVEPNEHKKNVSSEDPKVAGAGDELRAALRVRQKQLKKK